MQIVGYRTATDGDPASLRLAGPDGPTREPLQPGGELAFALDARHCAGVVVDGHHHACDAPTAPHCPDHASTWVCARCTGTCLKAEMDCLEPHAVYLAAFAPDTFKVGVTKEWRLETRLREQGADRAAHLQTVADGRTARQIEAEIATRLTDRVRVPTKIRGLGTAVDGDAWHSLLADFDVVDTYAFDYGLDVDRPPVPETTAAGTVVGTKGRVLVLATGGTTYAVDLRDLVGYEVTPGTGDADRQASLASFD